MGQSVIWALLSGTLIVLTTTHQSVSDSEDLCTPCHQTLPSEGDGGLVLIFRGQLYALIWALLGLSFSSPLRCDGSMSGSFLSEMQFDKFSSSS